MRAFRLNKSLPMLNAGVVFVYDQFNESGLGSIGSGAMILAWDNGNCQYGDKNAIDYGSHAWCGATYVLPGQTHKDEAWFTEIQNPKVEDRQSHRQTDLRFYISIKKHTFMEVS